MFNALQTSGYSGYVGMEFAPTGDSKKAAAEALDLVKG
jgi:hydroxypyruvate isomerase